MLNRSIEVLKLGEDVKQVGTICYCPLLKRLLKF